MRNAEIYINLSKEALKNLKTLYETDSENFEYLVVLKKDKNGNETMVADTKGIHFMEWCRNEIDRAIRDSSKYADILNIVGCNNE